MLVHHPDEARLAALVGTCGSPLGVGRREEEHVACLDERAVVLADGLGDEQVVDPVGQRARVELVLQRTTSVVVPDGHGHLLPRPPVWPCPPGRVESVSLDPRDQGSPPGRPFQQVGRDPAVQGADCHPDDPRRQGSVEREVGGQRHPCRVVAPSDEVTPHQRSRPEMGQVRFRRDDPPPRTFPGAERGVRRKPSTNRWATRIVQRKGERRLSSPTASIPLRGAHRRCQPDLEGVRVVEPVRAGRSLGRWHPPHALLARVVHEASNLHNA